MACLSRALGSGDALTLVSVFASRAAGRGRSTSVTALRNDIGPLATTPSSRPGNAGELPGQGDTRARVVGAHEPLLVGGEAAHVVHLEEELAGAEGVTGVLPGQLEQTEALRRPRIVGNEIAVQVGADVGIVQIGLARAYQEAWAAGHPVLLRHRRIV